MSSWLSWIPFLIYLIISIISIHFLIKLYSNVAKNVKKYTELASVNNTTIINKERRLCERCYSVLASSATKNYHNKNQIKYKTLDDESYRRCVNDRENELLSSSDDDQNVIGQVSTREAISYDRQSENIEMLDVCHRKNSVSMLRKQFENIGDKKPTVCNLEKQVSEKFFKRTSSPVKRTRETIDQAESEEPSSIDNNYYSVENVTVYTVVNDDKGAEKSSTDKYTKLISSKRSRSHGDIKGLKRSLSHDIIAEEPILMAERTKSVEGISEDFDDIEYRQTNRGSVKSFDDILRQERFSKCYSEYSISDLVNDLPDDGDSEFVSFFNTNK